MSHVVPVGREVTLTLSWDDRPPAEVDPDLQGASGTIEVALRPVGGELRCTRDVAASAGALLRFDDALAGLLHELTGSATLEPLVDYDLGDFGLTVTLKAGKGAVSGFVATSFPEARLAFDGVEIDQTYVAETRRRLRLLLAARPG
ncbi:MAG TPA: hypothetical protein VLB86_10500 [Gaiellaceae bacterium]|nr:hypothetical protein [Gaiellaceae bacterium]